jgi:predicted aspartyl protease
MPPIVRLFAVLCLLAFADSVSAHPGPGPSFPEPASQGDRADTAFDMSGRMATIEVMIDGQGPFHFGVDTGAQGYAHIGPAVAERLKLKAEGEAMASDPTGRNPVRVAIYSVPSLSIGGVAFSDLSATAMNMPPALAGKVDGILGIDLFKAYLLTLDYAHGRLELERGALHAADGRTVLDYRADGPLIEVPLKVGGQTVLSHVDTGHLSPAIAVPKSVADTLRFTDAPRKLGTAHTISNTFDIYGATLTSPVMVGTTPLTTQIEWPTIADHANLGVGALAGTVVRIDQRNHRIQFAKAH